MTDIRLLYPISGQDIICLLSVNEAAASIVAICQGRLAVSRTGVSWQAIAFDDDCRTFSPAPRLARSTGARQLARCNRQRRIIATVLIPLLQRVLSRVVQPIED